MTGVMSVRRRDELGVDGASRAGMADLRLRDGEVMSRAGTAKSVEERRVEEDRKARSEGGTGAIVGTGTSGRALRKIIKHENASDTL